MELFFDVETSGFINKKLGVNDAEQAWVVQLAAILSTKDEIIKELNIIVQPLNDKMNPYAEKVHGISVKKAKEIGHPEAEVIACFADLQIDEPIRICHNYDFDSQFIDHMFKRNMDVLTDEQRSKFFIQLPAFCTMKSKEIITYCNLKNKYGKPKWPKLAELYFKLFKKDFAHAHDALADVKALRECYYELQLQGII